MRLRMKRMLLAVLAAAMSLVLSGCFVKTVDELYTLPKHSDEYNRLEQAIDQVMSSQNASYAAPVSGMNQQSVQLADLDGDGTEEAVAFLKTNVTDTGNCGGTVCKGSDCCQGDGLIRAGRHIYTVFGTD